MKKIMIVLSLITLMVAFVPAQDTPPMSAIQEKLYQKLKDRNFTILVGAMEWDSKLMLEIFEELIP